MTFERELLKGSTESIILSLLLREPMYGYRLAREIEQRSDGYFKFRGGTLYPALHRLEREGMIDGKWQSTPGMQQRRYYFITEKGRTSLSRRAAHWRGFADAVSRVILPDVSAT